MGSISKSIGLASAKKKKKNSYKQIKVMEQRASALQARLEARRNMFLKAEQNTYGSDRPTGPTSLPSTAPPQPPASVPRNVKDALNILNSSKTNGDSDSNRRFSPDKNIQPPPYSETENSSAPETKNEKPEKIATTKKVKQLDGYVGFANLPNQVYRKAVKKGFEFTLMVVGESGLGKSTLINSMFLTDVYSAEH